MRPCTASRRAAGLVMQWGLTPFIPGDLAKLLLAASLVPAGWLAVRAFQFGPEQALRGESAPQALRLGPVAVAAGVALAVSAFLPWRSGDLGITAAAGQVVLVAGIAATLGAWLLTGARLARGSAISGSSRPPPSGD